MPCVVRLFGVALLLSSGTVLHADDWPQWLGPRRDSVWRETRILDKLPDAGPKVLWRKEVAGGYAGPAVASGKVYLADFSTAADINKVSSPNDRPKIDGKERFQCFDAKSGERLWSKDYPVQYSISYPAGPRCTPTVHEGKVYFLGAEGNLYCLDAAKGTELWSKDFKRDFKAKTPIWGFCGHPLADGKKLICIVGGEDGVAYAFDKDTGAEIWHALEAREPGYSAPSIIEAGGARQLIIWHAEAINGLDPDSGRVYWSKPLESQYGMSIMVPRKSGDLLFAGAIGFKALALRLAPDRPEATEVWRGKQNNAVYPVNSEPFLEDGLIYGVDQPGALRAVKLETAERLWETYQPVAGVDKAERINSGTAFLVKNGERFFLFSETGHLIIARLSPAGYQEISRWKMLEPTGSAFGRKVVWSHPAFANRCVYARNDKELVCVSLAAD